MVRNCTLAQITSRHNTIVSSLPEMIIMCVQAVTLHTNLGTLKLELFCEQVKAAA